MPLAYHPPEADVMGFDRAEAQILATLYALELRPEEWWHGRRGRLDRQQLLEHAQRFWDDELASWTGSIEALEAKGLLVENRTSGELSLTPDGVPPAAQLRDAYRRRRLADVLREAESSPAYLAFCRRTSGFDLRAFSPIDERQLEFSVEAASLSTASGTGSSSWLDAGCGAGHVTEYVAGLTQSRALGVDSVPEAIELARRRVGAGDGASLGDQVPRFEVWDFESDEPPPASDLDAVLAIDSLAFVDRLEVALERLRGCLAPGGRLVALTLEASGTPAEAPTARALAALGFEVEQRDLSDIGLPLLRARAFAVLALRGALRREGHALLGRVLAQESERLAPLLAAGQLRRYLYRAVKPI